MVVEVLANSGKVDNDGNIDAGQQSWVADARDLEDLGSVD
jgi:hypothetical protein